MRKTDLAAGAIIHPTLRLSRLEEVMRSSLVAPPLGTGYLDSGTTAAYAATLASFNEGAIGPGACIPPDPGEDG